MTRHRPQLRVEALVALVALYMVAFGNGEWWRAVTAGRASVDPYTWLFVAACFVALVAAHFVVFALVANRWIVKPLLGVLVVATGAAAYYMRNYHVLLDATMLQNILATDVREASELLSGSMFASVLLWSALPLALIGWVRIAKRPWLPSAGYRAAALAAGVVVMGASLSLVSRDLTSLMREHREMRYLVTPGNFIVSLATNAVRGADRGHGPKRVVGADAHVVRAAPAAPAPRPRVIVFVLGETARAANFSLLGYTRRTNPQLETLPVVAFSQVQACGTSTEISVPCLFSPYGRHDYDEAAIRGSEGLLHVLRHAGVAVKWRDNQSGCKGVCDAPGVDYRHLGPALAPELCRGDECFDEILLRSLREDLAAVTGDTLIVQHMLGNHGPAYYRRYPDAFRRFTPDCRTAELRDCSREEVVNAFDNAILYTDYVLAETIRELDRVSDRVDAMLVYVSDHGESLGESGLYLHGVPYRIAPDLQTHVPMLVWSSGGLRATTGLDERCLQGRAQDALSHDNVFHSMLGMLDVSTAAYRPGLDPFARCRSASPATLGTHVAEAGVSVPAPQRPPGRDQPLEVRDALLQAEQQVEASQRPAPHDGGHLERAARRVERGDEAGEFVLVVRKQVVDSRMQAPERPPVRRQHQRAGWQGTQAAQ